MKKLGFYSFGVLSSALCFVAALSGCHNKKDKPKTPKPPVAAEADIISPPPELVCGDLEKKVFPKIQKGLCTNPSSESCLRFKSFLQAGAPTFSKENTNTFAVGPEITVPLEGKPILADDNHYYMILVMDQKKDKPITLGLIDIKVKTDEDNQKIQSFIHDSITQDSPAFASTALAAQSIIQREIDTTFFPLSPPQLCSQWVYFPISYIHDRPSDVIVRKQGSMYYILVVLYSPKREDVIESYFSYAPEPLKSPAPSVAPETTTPAPTSPAASNPAAGEPSSTTIIPQPTNPSTVTSKGDEIRVGSISSIPDEKKSSSTKPAGKVKKKKKQK